MCNSNFFKSFCESPHTNLYENLHWRYVCIFETKNVKDIYVNSRVIPSVNWSVTKFLNLKKHTSYENKSKYFIKNERLFYAIYKWKMISLMWLSRFFYRPASECWNFRWLSPIKRDPRPQFQPKCCPLASHVGVLYFCESRRLSRFRLIDFCESPYPSHFNSKNYIHTVKILENNKLWM